MRKFFLLLLFLAFIALVFGLFMAEQAGVTFGGFSGQASPSEKPLPQAWGSAERATVRLPAAGPAAAMDAAPGAASAAGDCPATVTVQPGDSLGAIAKRCGLSLNDLLALNPAITNPNRIFTGQQLNLQGERGGGAAEAVTAQPVGFNPGAQVVVEAGGFAPGAQVRVGIGLPGAGFQPLGVYEAGPDGLLSAELTIPLSARPGERAFFLFTSSGAPTVTVISEKFTISD